MSYIATREGVSNRGRPPESFLDQLIAWGKAAPDEIFQWMSDADRPDDVYSHVFGALGPYTAGVNRKAVMLEIMRVLAGFESSWNWNEGRDTNNPSSNQPDTTEAGAWQVSANSMAFGPELKELVQHRVGSTHGLDFQSAMKRDHALAMEYIARLLRRTTRHNGPVHRHEIDKYLSREAVKEFESFLTV